MTSPLLRNCMAHLEPIHAALGLAPDRASIEKLLAAWARIPAWVAEGYMPALDAVVVHEVARAIQPSLTVEIGTASGVSVCAVALGLTARGPLGTRRIHTYDADTTCYFDRSREVGSAAAEILPELAPALTFHRGQASELIPKHHPPRSIEMAVIDGDHRHPFPLIDLAHLAPLLAPGAWVVLHDTHLPEFSFPQPGEAEPRRYLHTGAQRLYDAWPGPKAEPAPGSYVNIGIVRVPDGGIDLDVVRRLLQPEPFDPETPRESAVTALRRASLDPTSTARG